MGERSLNRIFDCSGKCDFSKGYVLPSSTTKAQKGIVKGSSAIFCQELQKDGSPTDRHSRDGITREVISSLIYNPACQHYFCVMAIATRSTIVLFFATSRPSVRS